MHAAGRMSAFRPASRGPESAGFQPLVFSSGKVAPRPATAMLEARRISHGGGTEPPHQRRGSQGYGPEPRQQFQGEYQTPGTPAQPVYYQGSGQAVLIMQQLQQNSKAARFQAQGVQPADPEGSRKRIASMMSEMMQHDEAGREAAGAPPPPASCGGSGGGGGGAVPPPPAQPAATAAGPSGRPPAAVTNVMHLQHGVLSRNPPPRIRSLNGAPPPAPAHAADPETLRRGAAAAAAAAGGWEWAGPGPSWSELQQQAAAAAPPRGSDEAAGSSSAAAAAAAAAANMKAAVLSHLHQQIQHQQQALLHKQHQQQHQQWPIPLPAPAPPMPPQLQQPLDPRPSPPTSGPSLRAGRPPEAAPSADKGSRFASARPPVPRLAVLSSTSLRRSSLEFGPSTPSPPGDYHAHHASSFSSGSGGARELYAYGGDGWFGLEQPSPERNKALARPATVSGGRPQQQQQQQQQPPGADPASPDEWGASRPKTPGRSQGGGGGAAGATELADRVVAAMAVAAQRAKAGPTQKEVAAFARESCVVFGTGAQLAQAALCTSDWARKG
jgi:hypothetical protein